MKRIVIIGGGIAGLLTVLALLIAANLLVQGVRVRLDMTEEKLYTLSDGSCAILASLEKDVTIKFFYSRSLPQAPANLKAFATQVEDMLHEMKLGAGGRLAIDSYDPKPDTDAEEWAQKLGIAGQSLGIMGPTMYLGLVAESGGRQAAIPFIDPRSGRTMEYNLIRLIYRVTHPEKPVIGIMSPLPVLGSEAPPFAMPGQPRQQQQKAWFVFDELRKDYDVRQVDTTSDAIEDDVNTLIIVHPKELSEGTLYAIDQFLMRGGRVMAFVDPICASDPAAPPGQFGPRQSTSSMRKLFDAWGVSVSEFQVVADVDASTRLRTGNNRVEDVPVWLSLTRGAEHMNDEDILTSELEMMMLPYAAAITVDGPADGLEVTSLLSSSENSASVSAMTAQFGMDGIRREFSRGMTRLDLAVRLHGRFKSAFPEGPPPAADDSEAPPITPVAPLTEATAEGTVILIGDVDLLSDNYTVRAMNFLGFNAYEPSNDNIAFVVNAVEQLSGSASLVGIRSRGRLERPFDRVVALEKKAELQWLDQEKALQARLQETRQKLSDLQSQKDSSQRFILSPQQQAAIDQFKQEEIKINRELREVRKSLRADIERLGIKVKAVNILAMPLMVCLAGVGFWSYRRSRTRR
tara:strand:+ start:321 stop:2216 length:1896 start_codon:yes stop_codon:yes gene_type:complete